MSKQVLTEWQPCINPHRFIGDCALGYVRLAHGTDPLRQPVPWTAHLRRSFGHGHTNRSDLVSTWELIVPGDKPCSPIISACQCSGCRLTIELGRSAYPRVDGHDDRVAAEARQYMCRADVALRSLKYVLLESCVRQPRDPAVVAAMTWAVLCAGLLLWMMCP